MPSPGQGLAGRYEVLNEVRAGSLTAVYRVRHQATGRELALKTVSRLATAEQRGDAEQALTREGEIRAALDHPALLPLYDKDTWTEGTLLVGPWLSGGSLLDGQRPRVPLPAVVSLAKHIGAGLDVLHARGWVHGDVAPRNILLDGEGRPRLIDFGSCVPVGSRRPPAGAPSTSEFRAHWRVTRLTAAPEGWSGEPVDGRADLYALGIILYFLAVGQWPFVADDPEALTRKHLSEPVPLPSARCSLLGPGIDDVLLRALAKRPEHRFETGACLAEALREALASAEDGPPERKKRTTESGELGLPLDATCNAAERAREQVERFAAELPEEERQVFSAALKVLRRRDEALRFELGGTLRAMAAPLAALRAAEDLGILRALGSGPQTAAALARVCTLPPENIERLCRFLEADQKLNFEGGCWSLRPPLLATYERTTSFYEGARPVGETQLHWAELASWVRTGKPPAAMDAGEDGRGYVASARSLGDNGEAHAREVARALSEGAWVPDRSAILDVGAGSAVWSLALAARWPEAVVTALDRPKVLAVARARAQAEGLEARLRTIAGSWQAFDPPPERFGLILLCKVCHLESVQGLGELFSRLRPLLAKDGRLILVDTIPERLGGASIDALRYDLSLALRTQRGRIHDRPTYEEALAKAQLRTCASWSVTRQGAGLDVIVAQAAPDAGLPGPATHGPTQEPRAIPGDVRRGKRSRAPATRLDLPTLLAPATEATLRDHMRRRKVLHLASPDPDRFGGLFDYDQLVGLLQRGAVPREKIRITKNGETLSLGKRGLLDEHGRIDGLAFRSLCEEGVSVILNRLGAAHSASWALARDVEQRIGDRVELAAIASFSSTEALRAHYDYQDVLILQLDGVKHWTLLGDPVGDPRPLGQRPPAVPEVVTGSIPLHPGDVLFVPRGQHHVCRADPRSLHLALVITRRTGDHFMSWLAKRCETEPLFGATLPRYLGTDELEGHEARLKRYLHELIDDVSLQQFLEEDDASLSGVAELDLSPPAGLDATDIVRLATLRRIPLPPPSQSTLKLRALALSLTPVSRAVIEAVNAEIAVTVGTLMSRLAAAHDPAAIEGAIEELAGAGLLSIRK